LGRFASLPLGLRRKLRDLESLASRLEVAVKPPAFNVEPDLELLCRNVMEARMEYRPCRHMLCGFNRGMLWWGARILELHVLWWERA
jgi:hypothetical protein